MSEHQKKPRKRISTPRKAALISLFAGLLALFVPPQLIEGVIGITSIVSDYHKALRKDL